MNMRSGDGVGPAHTERTITVKAGDSMWSLAEQVYGKGQVPLGAIYEANHQNIHVKIVNGRRQFVAPTVTPGEQLIFPAREDLAKLSRDFFCSHANSDVSQKVGEHVALKAADTPGAVSQIEPKSSTVIHSGQLKKEIVSRNPATDVLNAALHSGLNPPTTEQLSSHKQVGKKVELSLVTRVGNVAESLADGLVMGGLREGLYESCQDPLGTAARVGTAVALGAAFGVATGGAGFVAEAAGALGIGLTVAGAFDSLNPNDKTNAARNKAVVDCVKQAWNAPDRITVDNCNWKMEKALGQPGFDLALGLLGGHAGSRLGGCFVPPRLIAPPSISTELTTLKPTTAISADVVPLEVTI